MKKVFTCELDVDKQYHDVLRDISIHSSKFYNMTLYELSQGNYQSQTEYYHQFKNHFRCGYLQMHTYCHVIKQAMKDVKSFFELKKKYDKAPEKNQCPGFPRYKNDNRLMSATFLKTAIRLKDSNLLLSVGKKMKSEKQIQGIYIELPKEVYGLLSDKNLKMVTLKAGENGKYQLKIVYEFQEKELKETGDLMALDLGVNNLAAITFMESCDQMLIDGRVLKSKIATYNNLIGKYYSKEMQVSGSQTFKLTKKLKNIMKKRNGYVDYYIHKSSRMIIDIAKLHNVKTIIIGDFKHIKKENKIKYFVQIPHARLIEQIKYKAKEEGIGVVMQEESYTSIVSSIDLENVKIENANKERRVFRGLFKTTYGLINADINGSLNIMRKYVGEKNNPKLIERVRDKGFREDPIRLNVV